MGRLRGGARPLAGEISFWVNATRLAPVATAAFGRQKRGLMRSDGATTGDGNILIFDPFYSFDPLLFSTVLKCKPYHLCQPLPRTKKEGAPGLVGRAPAERGQATGCGIFHGTPLLEKRRNFARKQKIRSL